MYCRHVLGFEWGPKGPPFYIAQPGHFILRLRARTRARDPVLGPRVHIVKIVVYIYPQPPVASNPKVSISSSPAFTYRITCTCIFLMLFRSTCSWLFSVDNPLRVATEALNIHLVSCILYMTALRNRPSLAFCLDSNGQSL